MDYKELRDFIKNIAKSGISEVDIETDELKLKVKVNSEAERVTHTETVIQQVPVHSSLGAVPMMQSPVQNFQMPPAQGLNNGENTGTTETTQEKETDKYLKIKSPMVGTFYRKSSPDAPPFVSVGDSVSPDSVVCIIEAMKLFNEIESEISGKIVKILVEDATPVEFDQELFWVDPN
ncbi:MAG: acetyl-CoA carboxylase, biotin carboxyl carrier protein [Bacteroidia bacterium]|nr:MAG: acetyl-CoA carboxylase, biotin carboxyl carrier protein [Bacteroidia bacterium]